MSTGDEILIHTVLAASGPLREKTPPTKLSELSVDQILESVTGCLKVIAANKKEILKSYPWLRDGVTTQGNVSTRFNIGIRCAEACLALGYSDPTLGYQSFLYSSNQTELRNIFMFLVTLMQEDSVDKDAQRIEDDCSAEHDDWCSCDQCVNGDIDDIVEHLPRETRAAYYARKEKEKQERDAAALSKHVKISTRNEAQVNEAVPEVSADDAKGGAGYEEGGENRPGPDKGSLGVSALQAMFEQKTATESSPPPSVPLSKHADYTIPVTEKISEGDSDSNEEEHQESLVDPDEKCETEVGFDDEIGLERLRSERKVLEEEVNQMTVEHRKLRQQIRDNETNTGEGNRLMTQIKSDLERVESSNEKRRKLLTLLPESQENTDKMVKIVQKNKDKQTAMRQKWTETLAALDAEYESLCISAEQKEKDSCDIVKHNNALNKQIQNYEDLIVQKEFMAAKISKELRDKSKMEAPFSRSNYTTQISEILKSVAKQKDETAKVIAQIKSAQGDINLMEGKLHRTYLEADARVFNAAKLDGGQLRSTYQVLTEINQSCEDVIENIRKTGQTKRALISIQDQITAEKSKNIATNHVQLTHDLQQVRLENKKLKERLKAPPI